MIAYICKKIFKVFDSALFNLNGGAFSSAFSNPLHMRNYSMDWWTYMPTSKKVLISSLITGIIIAILIFIKFYL